MNSGSVVLWPIKAARRCIPVKIGLVSLAAVAFTSAALAQNAFSFRDDRQLNDAMLQLAARTSKDLTLPRPCHLHIVAIAGGRELFAGNTFDKMNVSLARGIAGNGLLKNCRIDMHELDRQSANALFRSLGQQGENTLILETTYIPLTDTIAAFSKLRDGTGRHIGESGRFDLPVQPANILATASISPALKALPHTDAAPKPAAPIISPPRTAASVKLTDKLLTEVHFDSRSADITYVGKQKIEQAIEAIKKQNPREIRILGFTDSKGDAAANKAMAGARASNVAKLLRAAGLDLPMTVEGRGEKEGPYKIPDGVSEPLNRCVGIIAVGVPQE